MNENREQRRAAERDKSPKEVQRERLDELHGAGTPQDVADPRKKSERHGKVTADKWNQ
jgi:hypothetical protein